MRSLNALDAQLLFHALKLRDLLSKGIHAVFSLLVLNESGVGLSRTAKGDNPAVVLFRLLIAGINVLQPLLLRGVVSHQLIQGLEFGVESLRCPPDR